MWCRCGLSSFKCRIKIEFIHVLATLNFTQKESWPKIHGFGATSPRDNFFQTFNLFRCLDNADAVKFTFKNQLFGFCCFFAIWHVEDPYVNLLIKLKRLWSNWIKLKRFYCYREFWIHPETDESLKSISHETFRSNVGTIL